MAHRLRAAFDDWLGKRQYAIGKHHVRRGNYAAAIEAFEAAAEWHAQKEGSQHPYVAAALMQQGWCNAVLARREAACRAYKRALEIIEVTDGADHPATRAISSYLASNCCG
jgi:tetratricopeptide (TPR) repeat protein